MTTQDFDKITAKKPIKSLLVTKRRTNGRNNQGRITVRHRGGGVRRHYRLVNFKQLDFEKAIEIRETIAGLKARLHKAQRS
jgi:ribosomal protein L2